MKHSIRIRLVTTLAIIVGCIILLFWITNKTFLPRYYENYKIDMLGKAYQSVCTIYAAAHDGESEENQEAGYLDDEINIALESLGANQSLNLYLFQLINQSGVVYIKFLYPLMDVFSQRLVSEQILSDEGKRQLIIETESYSIYKVYDKRVDSIYLELVGTIDGETGIFVRSNYQSMMESVGISNRFLALIGVVVSLLGITIMYGISRNFTKPILELTDIATRMSNLDFDVTYQVNRKDEIGTLGDSVNTLARRLETTILELKAANNQLQKDIEKKDQIDQMRTEFLSNVSHELKTPIALIQGYAEGLIENVNDDEESRRFYCEVIVDEAAKMNQMVKKLLSLNHIEFGENAITFQHFDVVAVIKSVLDETEILFQQNNVILHFEPNHPIYVWADEYMVEEVFTNYISNALNHVAGAKIIEVKLIEQGDHVRIAVFNTGEKIPDDDMDKIWDKFYKVDKARTREYGGSGIGLSIVKAIMTSLNQGYGVVNHTNGVEFWFELDCKNEEVIAEIHN